MLNSLATMPRAEQNAIELGDHRVRPYFDGETVFREIHATGMLVLFVANVAKPNCMLSPVCEHHLEDNRECRQIG